MPTPEPTFNPSLAPPPEFGIRGDYQRVDTSQTLREGLAEYYRVNPGLCDPATITNDRAATHFHNHDCTHVLFGTHTGPLDEAVNDFLTLFAVDLPYGQYLWGFLASGEVGELAKPYASVSLLAKMTWRSLKLLPKIRRTAKKMHRKWPWSPPERLMDQRLTDIRREFGLEVFRPDTELGLIPAAS